MIFLFLICKAIEEIRKKNKSGSAQKNTGSRSWRDPKKDSEHYMYYGPTCPETSLQSTRESNTPLDLPIVINPASDPRQAILFYELVTVYLLETRCA
jgi:hypothetical protein